MGRSKPKAFQFAPSGRVPSDIPRVEAVGSTTFLAVLSVTTAADDPQATSCGALSWVIAQVDSAPPLESTP